MRAKKCIIIMYAFSADFYIRQNIKINTDWSRLNGSDKIKELKKISLDIKLGAVEAVYSASSGHPGGSLSISDILAYLYFVEMNIDPKNPQWADRDRFVLSKGHCSPDCMQRSRLGDISARRP